MFDRRTLPSRTLVWLAAVLVPLQSVFAAACCCTQVDAPESEAAAGVPYFAGPHCCSDEPEPCCAGQHSGSPTCCQGWLSGDRSHCECPGGCCSGHEGDPSNSALPEGRAGYGEVPIQPSAVHGFDGVRPCCVPLVEAPSSSAISGSQRCIVLCRLTL